MASLASRFAVTGIVSGVALIMTGCATTGIDDTANASSDRSVRTAAMIATYRHLFANNASSLQAKAATYCIATGTGAALADPETAILTALSDVTPEVRPVSTCKRQERATDAQGRPASIFNLSLLACETRTSCLFNGGYYEGNVSASGGNYRARLIGGVWQVAPEGPQAIS